MGVASMEAHSTTHSVISCQRCGFPCSSCGNESKENVKDFTPAKSPPSSSNGSCGSSARPYSPPTTTHYHHHHHLVTTTANLDLQHQIEVLNARLKQNNEHVQKLEQALSESRISAQGDVKKLQAEVKNGREKYERLLDSHRQTTRVNQMLEDKILSVAERRDVDKALLEQRVRMLEVQLESNLSRTRHLETMNLSLRRDCALAARLLHVRSASFLPRRPNELPPELRDRVNAHLTYDELKALEDAEAKASPAKGSGLFSFLAISPSFISTFPPSAMAFSLNDEKEEKEPAKSDTSHSVIVDMGDDVDGGALPTSVFTRIFEAASQTTDPNDNDGLNSGGVDEQEKFLSRFSSSSSSNSRDDVPARVVTCRRCRLQCVTVDRWTQTCLGPIYGGDGAPPPFSPSSVPYRSATPSKGLSVGMPRRTLGAFKNHSSGSPSLGSLGSIPHANTYPDLVASAEIFERRRRDPSFPTDHDTLFASDDKPVFRSIPSDTNDLSREEADISLLEPFSKDPSSFVQSPRFVDHEAQTTWGPAELRGRHDSDSASVSGVSLSGGGWGDIHICTIDPAGQAQDDARGHSQDEARCCSQLHVTDDFGLPPPHPSLAISTSTELTPCLEEIDLDDTV